MSDDDFDLEKPAKKTFNLKFLLVVGAIATLVLLNIGVVLYFTVFSSKGGGEGEVAEASAEHGAQDGHAAPEKKIKREGKPIYIPLDPPFIVNFEEQSLVRFLQVSINLMVYGEESPKAVTEHMPIIRDTLVMLFSAQSYEILSTREGKEKIRLEGLKAIQDILKAQDAKSDIAELFFTSFVMQ